MRRTLTLFVLATVLSGCSTLYSALPSRSLIGSGSGMTVEEYAIGRLPGRAAHKACPKAARSATHQAKPSGKSCAR